ncbi:EscU/YscU/HrcU family type III secretion system export apparatus switch protein [Tetrasphaera sp. HKS02]|uniref:EscU/YscU/HrcU family type III secretion system export apparatus switch protein n=1 Tax=Nostocoides sp. HKS02 TaxID=1813880 RepID=UPI0012B4F8CC|nr:hypothetical protein GKE56_09050 [Tetrasphaera sp. HKS02]
MSDKSQRTEKPTAQRLRKARGDGQVPRTQELGAWLSVLAFTVVVPHLVGGWPTSSTAPWPTCRR